MGNKIYRNLSLTFAALGLVTVIAAIIFHIWQRDGSAETLMSLIYAVTCIMFIIETVIFAVLSVLFIIIYLKGKKGDKKVY